MTETDIDRLEARIAELESARQNEEGSLRRSSKAMVGISLAIFLIVASFAIPIYLHARSEWTEDKLAASFQHQLEELNPTTIEQTRALGEHLLPIYVAETRKQLMQMGPEISRRLGRQMDLLAQELSTELHAQLMEAEKRIQKQTTEILFQSYPHLADQAQQDRLASSFRFITETAMTNALADFSERFSVDVAALADTIVTFTDADPEETTLELQKRFIHLWLKLLDIEIMKL